MSKAKVLAREIYPDWELTNNPKLDGVEQSEVRIQRAAFVEGYRQAEKDLALTWEDIESIHTLMAHQEVAPILWKCGNEAFYQEVLKRFKEGKRNDT